MTFEQWKNEVENYSTRWERCLSEFESVDIDRLHAWLYAAYQAGEDQGWKECYTEGL